MATAGLLELTAGDGESTMPAAMWYREPVKVPAAKAEGKIPATAAGAGYALGGSSKGLPWKLAAYQLRVDVNDSFLRRDSTAVILSNLCREQERRVYFKEMMAAVS